MLAVTAVGVLSDVGRSLREAVYMLWDTLWALVLGFTLSGAVQAFVSRRAMQAHLGRHSPAAVARAGLYGMVSSSCSYAASAMARSLFARGADFLTAMVFLFASTNLVLELGIVLAVLIGWQLLVAELLGGVVMIVLLVGLGTATLRGRAVARARQAVDEEGGGEDEGAEREPWRRRIRTRAGWGDAAGYTLGDLFMLRRELLGGFVVAGFLAVLVPTHIWSDLFVRGHGAWTDVENAAVAPFVAVVSCVCSVGNVPLAAALWHGGISYGGVVAFVFADLVSLPLLFVYRRQYGTAMAVRMLAVFWPVMSAAGLLTGWALVSVGVVPPHRRGPVVSDAFASWPTTALDICALALLAGLWWLHRHRAGTGYARDPVCGMQVDTTVAPPQVVHGGRRYWFCSEHCAARFAANPERYAAEASQPVP